MTSFADTPIGYLKGVGPQRAELLQSELSVFTIMDFLQHFPFRYVDRTHIYKVSELTEDLPYVQLKGTISDLREIGKPRQKRLTGKFSDGTGTIELVWFKGVSWIKSNIKPGTTYMLFGKPSAFNKTLNIAHPELDSEENLLSQPRFQAVYPSTDKLRTKKLDNRVIRSLMMNVFQHPSFEIREYLAEEILKRFDLIPRDLAFKWIHFPSNPEEMNAAQKRLKFDEFFLLQISIIRLKLKRSELPGIIFSKVGDKFNQFYQQKMEFELTEAQKRVIREIRMDMGSGRQMNRLLQGDVGSGKSIVAILCILIAIDNGYQASLMAPTEILAAQHFTGFVDALHEIGVRTALLTGSTKTAERRDILATLENGDIDLLIGTHALIEDPVKFRNQGLVIIDEQHRFGVAQRATLWSKSNHPPHVLVMTATPIPRTLAMTVYGDLDVSRIDELPGGRKPIITAHRRESHRLRVRGFMKEQIDLGRQVYVVFPLIEESETLDYKNLNEGFDHIVQFFLRPQYQVDMLHGRMKPADKDEAMRRFKEGITDILVSTTVIEVGINVPNATVMVIESAEKFGLAQLHQLRGRVGRGSEQSYCILMSGNKLTQVARERLQAMVQTTDGFEIAEFDLKLRGPGDIEGTRQSGLVNLKLASITKDEGILKAARVAAIELLEKDPELSKTEHQPLVQQLRANKGYRDWSRVS
ncbi:MAG: ATP-dependent DNA helicase RecG [Bacteroidetes bacterium]|nr:ATP-dependent DNA helicase RecG [Bacteroidota bacterium]